MWIFWNWNSFSFTLRPNFSLYLAWLAFCLWPLSMNCPFNDSTPAHWPPFYSCTCAKWVLPQGLCACHSPFLEHSSLWYPWDILIGSFPRVVHSTHLQGVIILFISVVSVSSAPWSRTHVCRLHHTSLAQRQGLIHVCWINWNIRVISLSHKPERRDGCFQSTPRKAFVSLKCWTNIMMPGFLVFLYFDS